MKKLLRNNIALLSILTLSKAAFAQELEFTTSEWEHIDLSHSSTTKWSVPISEHGRASTYPVDRFGYDPDEVEGVYFSAGSVTTGWSPFRSMIGTENGMTVLWGTDSNEPEIRVSRFGNLIIPVSPNDSRRVTLKFAKAIKLRFDMVGKGFFKGQSIAFSTNAARGFKKPIYTNLGTDQIAPLAAAQSTSYLSQAPFKYFSKQKASMKGYEPLSNSRGDKLQFETGSDGTSVTIDVYNNTNKTLWTILRMKAQFTERTSYIGSGAVTRNGQAPTVRASIRDY